MGATIVFFFLSIIITVIVTRHYTSRSELNVILTSVIDIVRISSFTKGNISVYYNQREIKSLTAIRLIIENSGNTDISNDQVKKPPSLLINSDAEIISIDNLSYSEASKIILKQDQNNSVLFGIEYLARRKSCAVQILVHMRKYEPFSSTDLDFKEGIIKNTKIQLIRLDENRFDNYYDRYMSWIYRNIKKLQLVFLVIGIIMILFGLFIAYNMYISEIVGLSENQFVNWSTVLFSWIIGGISMLPYLFQNGKVKYQHLFYEHFVKKSSGNNN